MAAPLLAAIFKSAIIARYLGPPRMGLYSFAMWAAGALSLVASLGLPSAVTKYVSEYLGRGDRAQAARISRHLLRLQWIVVLTVAPAAGLAAFFLAEGPEKLVLVLTASLAVPLVATEVLGSVLAGCQHYKQLSIISLKSSVADVGLIVLAVILKSGVAGILVALTAGSSLAAWMSYRAARPMLLAGQQGAAPTDASPFRRARSFAFTESYIVLLDGIIWQRSEVAFLKALSTLRQVAFYGIGFGLARKFSDILATFTDTLMPLSSEAFGRSGLQDIGKIYETSLKYVQIALAPLCALGIGLSAPLIGLIYGPAYLPLVPVFRLLLASVAVTSLAYVGASVLYATEHQGFIAKCQTPIAVLNIALDLTLIPAHGAMGAAFANAGAQVLEAVILLAYAPRVVAGRFPWRAVARIYAAVALANLPVAIALWGGAPPWSITGLAVVGLGIYVAILVAWGELGKSELKILSEALGRPLGLWLSGSMESSKVE